MGDRVRCEYVDDLTESGAVEGDTTVYMVYSMRGDEMKAKRCQRLAHFHISAQDKQKSVKEKITPVPRIRYSPQVALRNANPPPDGRSKARKKR